MQTTVLQLKFAFKFTVGNGLYKLLFKKYILYNLEDREVMKYYVEHKLFREFQKKYTSLLPNSISQYNNS